MEKFFLFSSYFKTEAKTTKKVVQRFVTRWGQLWPFLALSALEYAHIKLLLFSQRTSIYCAFSTTVQYIHALFTGVMK